MVPPPPTNATEIIIIIPWETSGIKTDKQLFRPISGTKLQQIQKSGTHMVHASC